MYALPKIYDAHVIKADYLIENIDLSFKMWKECPWNQDFHHVGFCREMCDQAVYAMRACGIPVTVDMFVYSPEYQGSHQWNVVRGKNGHFYPFWTSWYEMNNNKKGDGRKKGKVYRQCFGMQKEAIKGITSRKNVPPLFKNRFIKDVTVDYTGTNKIAVKVETEDPYIYWGVLIQST